MKERQIRNIIIHGNENADHNALPNKVNEFHVEVIERKLSQTYLTTKQKIAVIDEIIAILKSREVGGVIK